MGNPGTSAAEPRQTSRADAVERAYQAVTRMIAGGELEPGARLREQSLAQVIGVSRTPVREALSRLAAEGVVELSHNRGAQVASFSAADIDALFDVRSRLEPRAVALAVPRLSDEDLAELTDWSREMEAVAASGNDAERLNQLNNAFHGMFFDRCGNRLLAGALRGVIRPAIVAMTFHRYTPRALERSMHHHAEILEAAAADDAEWAESVMRTHILAARHGFAAFPRDGGPSAGTCP
jgi:DNA-binding GntR family transcriptional regulator